MKKKMSKSFYYLRLYFYQKCVSLIKSVQFLYTYSFFFLRWQRIRKTNMSRAVILESSELDHSAFCGRVHLSFFYVFYINVRGVRAWKKREGVGMWEIKEFLDWKRLLEIWLEGKVLFDNLNAFRHLSFKNDFFFSPAIIS